MAKKIGLKTPAQKKYASKKEKVAELRKVANQAALKAAKEWVTKNPDYADLKIKPANIAYIQRKGETTKALIELAQRMTYPSNRDKTQANILQDVQSMFPGTQLYNSLWQKPLPPSLLRKILPKVNNNLPKPINLQGCKTLSQIRKKVQASQQIATGKRSFKVQITFTNESVIIGKESYPLEMRSSNYCIRITLKNGKRCWVRVDGLAAVLMKA